jgi:CO dehydrogenase/acetyl-CoA synthase beta subunit
LLKGGPFLVVDANGSYGGRRERNLPNLIRLEEEEKEEEEEEEDGEEEDKAVVENVKVEEVDAMLSMLSSTDS